MAPQGGKARSQNQTRVSRLSHYRELNANLGPPQRNQPKNRNITLPRVKLERLEYRPSDRLQRKLKPLEQQSRGRL